MFGIFRKKKSTESPRATADSSHPARNQGAKKQTKGHPHPPKADKQGTNRAQPAKKPGRDTVETVKKSKVPAAKPPAAGKQIRRKTAPSRSAGETIRHPAVGEVIVSRSARARRISLNVKPDGTVRLSIPRSATMQAGLAFLDQKAEWVVSTRQRLAQRYPRLVVAPPYSTREHTLSMLPGEGTTVSVRLEDREIRVYYPSTSSPVAPEVQEAVKKGIEAAWRVEAKAYLPVRVEALARQHGLKFSSVSIRNTVSKWGSCSARNDLSLSLHLMRLPDHLIDYIILHELAHTVHHDHSPRFHALLDRLTDGHHAELRREMRGYNTRW